MIVSELRLYNFRKFCADNVKITNIVAGHHSSEALRLIVFPPENS